MRFPTGLASRTFLYTAGIVCAVLAAVVIVAFRDGRRVTEEAERRSLEQAADVTAQLLAGRGRSLAGGARVFVQSPYFRALVADGRRDDIVDQAFEAAEQLGASWVFITNERGTLLAKSDEPAVHGTPMDGIPLVARVLEGRTTSGYGVSRDSLLFQVVGVPIVVPGAAPVGALVATKIIDRQTAQDIRAATGAEVFFYALDTRGVPRVAATSFPSAQRADPALPAPGALPSAGRGSSPAAVRRARIGDEEYALQGAALTTAGGEVVGGFVVARPVGSVAPAIAAGRRSLLLGGMLGVALALAAAWGAVQRVTRPVRALAAAARHALDGKYETAMQMAGGATRAGASDEIASLAAGLVALLRELREKQSLVAMLGSAGTSPAQGTPLPPALPRHEGGARTIGPRAAGSARTPRAGVAAARLALPLRAGTSLAPGAVVAERYALQEVLGAGGTGIVFRAHDLTLNETVALKALRPDVLADDAALGEQLKHEVRLTRRISHRNVVRTYDFGSSGGIPFLTMEHVTGSGLSALLAQRTSLPADAVLAIAKQLLRALEAAHEQGVIHGDVKPANILLSTDGLLKVTDFGVATVIRRPRGLGAASESAGPPLLAGAVVGTPEYMAPELLLGNEPDVRTDLYAAAMVLHECLTGDIPFPRDTPREFLATKLDSPAAPPTPAGPQRPKTTLQGVIAWMTAAAPADRPLSAAEVSTLLDRLE
jgi:serine/threonine-protein kinase